MLRATKSWSSSAWANYRPRAQIGGRPRNMMRLLASLSLMRKLLGRRRETGGSRARKPFPRILCTPRGRSSTSLAGSPFATPSRLQDSSRRTVTDPHSTARCARPDTSMRAPPTTSSPRSLTARSVAAEELARRRTTAAAITSRPRPTRACGMHKRTSSLWPAAGAIKANAGHTKQPDSRNDRMPVIIAPADYHRWLSPIEPDPNDMMKPYPSEPMAIWPISTRVNSPGNDSPDIRDPIDP
jgi:hypothetical protein